MSPLEIASTVLGVAGVLLMIVQHVSAWPVGMACVALSAWVFYTTRLYSDVLLQIIYFVLLAYGWWNARRAPGRAGTNLGIPVTVLSSRTRLACIGAGIAATFVWGWLMHRTTDAALPYWDSFILMFSLISQWLQARKKIENWVGWMIVNAVAVWVYLAKDLLLFTGLYALYFAMAVGGWFAWRRSLAAAT